MNVTIASQCAPCCEVCGFAATWPAVISIDISGITNPACVDLGPTSSQYDFSAANNTFTLTGGFGGPGGIWEFNVSPSGSTNIVKQSYDMAGCTGTETDENLGISVQVSLTPVSGGCQLSVFVTDFNVTVGVFSFTGIVTRTNALDSVSNQSGDGTAKITL